MLDLNQVEQAAMLSLARNPQTDPQQLMALAEWLKLQEGADSAQPSTSFAYLNSQAPQGPLAIILERRTSPLLEALVANPNLPPMLALEFAADLPAAFWRIRHCPRGSNMILSFLSEWSHCAVCSF
ncbi:MAG: hypothetical protein LCH85_07365 [Chloroflexi bacterium]|nr:hypothetical protein [Chloroflexota bacterium]